MLDEMSIRSRALAAAMEPVIASVYFSPEGHQALHAIGFGESSGSVTDEWGLHHWGKCAMPDYPAYFNSRSAALGAPPGEVVAATFGVFQPAMVIEMINQGRAIADPAALRAARDKGAIAQLTRILGESPTDIDRAIELLELAGRDLTLVGRPMYAGLVSMGLPDQPVGRMWRLGDRLREFRGDAFVAAWAAAGFDGCRIQLLTEILAGFPRRSYTSARGWTEEEMDQAEAELEAAGYVAAGAPTDAGRQVREEVEQATDQACRPMMTAVGDDIVELVRIFRAWGDAVIAAHGHAPATPQEQVMDDSVRDWMAEHELSPFTFTVAM